MKKQPTNQPQPDVWGEIETTNPATLTSQGNHPLEEAPQATAFKSAPRDPSLQYDIDGLMTDFPTARELERFVFDETGVVLNLKGRANKLKYSVAMDVLNGVEVDPAFIGSENPYVDKADMVPTEDIKDPPARDPSLPSRELVQNSFHSRQVPHTDPDYRAQGRRCDVTFRKYEDGTITYEILGPIEPRPFGEKIDKFGRLRPEIIKWVDPRTGEQLVQRPDGTLTPVGKRLRALLQSMRVNRSNFWQTWVDREFISLDNSAIANPWDSQ
jgi:hypothetical protein